jgi:hypothetical protein
VTDEQLICWAAGFFDGEGCINLSKQTGKNTRKDGRVWMSYGLGVSICQKDPRPLETFHTLFGGHFYPYLVKGQTYWRWHCWSHGALHVLETLMPFMVLKTERAEVAIDFQKSMTAWNKDYGRRGYPDWVREKLEEFFIQMRTFNKRGILKENPAKTGPKDGAKNYFPAAGMRTKSAPKINEKGATSSIQ